MAGEKKKLLNLHSHTLKVKPSCHFSETVQKIKELLTGSRYKVDHHRFISSMQDSMNLHKTFQDALLEYDVEVVSVSESEDIAEILEYLKRKSNANANVVACVRLEVETGDLNLLITRKNQRLFETDYPCDVLFDIHQAGYTSEENDAQKFSEFQPVEITKQRSIIINAWLENYEKALGSVDALQNMPNQRQSPDETKGETILQIINKTIVSIWTNIVRFRQELLDIKEQCDCELYDGIIKIFIRRLKQAYLGRKCMIFGNALLSKFQLTCEEVKQDDFVNDLKEEIKIVQNQRLPVPDNCGIRRGCQLISFRCGLLDSKRGSMGFGFRTDCIDRIHVTISRSIDAAIDMKTVRDATQETRTVDKYIHENNLKMTREDRKRLFKFVNKYSEELMEKHSNLNRIGVSPVLSHKHGRIEEKPCIVMYCSCKGIRPPDEPEFQRQIENVPVDVREGYCSLFGVSGAKDYNDPLRTGISIGGQDIKTFGTLGPFVVEAENKSSVGFLTCQHVFPSAEIGRNVVQPSVEHYKEDTFPDTTICGEIRSMRIGDVTFNGKLTSVDVAYVALNKRIPKEFKFPDNPESMMDRHGNLQMGQPTMQLEEDDNDIHVYKLGQTSGLTKGLFDTTRGTVVLGKERIRNIYQVSSDEMFADHGDSGSSVFTVNGNTLSVIGLLLGGSDNLKECYVIPIGAALEALQPRLEIHQFKNETAASDEGSNDDRQTYGASPSGAQAGQTSSIEYPELSNSVRTFSSRNR